MSETVNIFWKTSNAQKEWTVNTSITGVWNSRKITKRSLKKILWRNSDLEALSDYQKQLANHTSFDMLFIEDCTGSMGIWISACKEELNVIINKLKNDFPFRLFSSSCYKKFLLWSSSSNELFRYWELKQVHSILSHLHQHGKCYDNQFNRWKFKIFGH